LKNTSINKTDQVIDANLDRAREGLRVIEEWSRFNIDDLDIATRLKDWRQRLGVLHKRDYKFSRDLESDIGLGLTHPAQKNRNSSDELISSNCSRVQEALRVIEEFSRNYNPLLSKTSNEIRYGLYEMEIHILRHSIRSKRLEKLKYCRLCLITSNQENLIDIVKESLKGGTRMVQYRCKEKSDLSKYEEAKILCKLCKDSNSLFIVNDRIDIALSVNADGVHLGQNDLPTKVVRKLIGSDMLIGRSTHSSKEIISSEEEDINYLGIGPVFKTESKPNLKSLGIEKLKGIIPITKLPIFAIGGINESNIKKIKEIGIKKVAVIGSIMNAKDPKESTKNLIQALQ